MESNEVLTEAFGRIQELVRRSLDGLDAEGLAFRPEPGTNSIAWLVWHLSRIEDDHLSGITGQEQVWADRSWVERTGIDRDPRTFGWGDGPEEVGAMRPPAPEGLLAYHEAVMARVLAYVGAVTTDELDRIVDTRFTPHVTAGVRLVSMLGDSLQHAGQALFVRGIHDRVREPRD
jgi:hypothetical protein